MVNRDAASGPPGGLLGRNRPVEPLNGLRQLSRTLRRTPANRSAGCRSRGPNPPVTTPRRRRNRPRATGTAGPPANCTAQRRHSNGDDRGRDSLQSRERNSISGPRIHRTRRVPNDKPRTEFTSANRFFPKRAGQRGRSVGVVFRMGRGPVDGRGTGRHEHHEDGKFQHHTTDR